MYSTYYDIFFSNNSVKPDRDTYIKGGYYRYDIPGRKVSVLAINTVDYMKENGQNFKSGRD